ncbi:hypothetical protein B296_00037053 [Ensete ventricosum]|uniref:Translation initiation factor 5A-like N-terminal domain-containing protein n=1 Tax=Ensete ventricosum TaxID=4639 RepID=A0A426WZZ6_ENSVE|nr:hypothetical protein B296_00037053 [Ensete ventricosum]
MLTWLPHHRALGQLAHRRGRLDADGCKYEGRQWSYNRLDTGKVDTPYLQTHASASTRGMVESAQGPEPAVLTQWIRRQAESTGQAPDLTLTFLALEGGPRAVHLATMSDEEHHFESKADAGASKTYPQQAGTVRKNGYLVIKGRPCKIPGFLGF